MAVVSLTTALSKVVREEIPRGLREQRPRLDPVWEDIIVTSFGVTSEGLGRDWKFLKTWVTGDSGAYQFEPNSILVGPNQVLDNVAGGNYPSVTQFAAGNTFPGRAETTAPVFFQSSVTLKEARGNFFVPAKWMQLDQFDSSIAAATREIIKGTVRKVSRAHALAFYTTDASAFILATMGGTSASAAVHTITLNGGTGAGEATGRVQMFSEGTPIDVYTGSTRQNDSPWVVTKRDPTNRQITIAKIGGSDIDLAVADTITWRNSRGNQPAGLHTWLVTSGTIHGISLTDYPQFKSLVSAETGPLTESKLTRKIGFFYDVLGTECELDTILTPAGVVHAYLENEDNLARYERNGRRLEVKAGWQSIDYAYEGRGFRWAVSQFIQPRSCYVVKLKNNIKEYVPPTLPGTGTMGEFANEIRFMANLGGLEGGFMHERVVSGTTAVITDNLESPFYRICELDAEQVQGIVMTGLDEANL